VDKQSIDIANETFGIKTECVCGESYVETSLMVYLLFKMARQFGFCFLFLLLWANYSDGADLPLEEQLRELRENYVRNLNVFFFKEERELIKKCY
jgi:hypothetical protein